MWDEFKRTLKIFRTPSPLELATRELTQAELALLEAQSAREYADAMVMYHGERIDRLRRYIRDYNDQ